MLSIEMMLYPPPFLKMSCSSQSVLLSKKMTPLIASTLLSYTLNQVNTVSGSESADASAEQPVHFSKAVKLMSINVLPKEKSDV